MPPISAARLETRRADIASEYAEARAYAERRGLRLCTRRIVNPHGDWHCLVPLERGAVTHPGQHSR